MSEYIKRLAQSAVRFTGQPSVISPQLEDYNRIPNIRRPMEGDATDYRLILYVGYIDTSDITITFPKQHVMCVAVKHGIKAIDAQSHRLSKVVKVPQVIRDAHCPLICSREDVCFFALPSNVKKSSLTAHMSQDGFLVIHSRRLSVDDKGKTGFDMKRLVVVKVCRDLEPSLSSADCRTMALSLIEQAATLAANVAETLCPDSEGNEEDASGRGEASEHTAENEARREEVVPEAGEVSRSEGSSGRVVQKESYFRPLHSSVETLRDLTREVVEDSRRMREAMDLTSRRKPSEEESRERSQTESAFTVVSRQQQQQQPKVITKRIPRVSGGLSRPDSRETGDGMRFKAIDMVVRNEGSPKRKDAKGKSCLSEPSTSARRDSALVVEEKAPESTDPVVEEATEGKEPDVEDVIKRKKPSDEKFSDSKDSSVEEKTTESEEPTEEKASVSKDPDVEEKAPESKDPVEEANESKELVVEEASESKKPSYKKASDRKDPDVKEKATESDEKASDSKDPDVEEKAPESKQPSDEKVIDSEKPSDEKVSESKEPSFRKKGTASAKASSGKKPSSEKCAESEKVSPNMKPSPEKDTEMEGKSASKDPSPTKGQSSPAKESSQPSKATHRRDSKTEAGDKAVSPKKGPPLRDCALLRNLLEKGTKTEGKSDSKDPSPAKGQSSPSKESSQPSKTTHQKDSTTEAGDKAVSPKKASVLAKENVLLVKLLEKDTKTEGESDRKVTSPAKGQSSPAKESSQVSKTKSRKDSKTESEDGDKAVFPKKEPSLEKDSLKKGKSDSKDPSPAKGQSSPSKESSQPSKTSLRKDSKTVSEAGDKASQQRDPQEAKEKVATKSLPMRSCKSAVASLAAAGTSKPPASPSKRPKVKPEEAPGTPSKRSKGKQKDTDASKR